MINDTERAELEALRRQLPALTRRLTILEQRVAGLRAGRGEAGSGSGPAKGERNYILSNADAAKRDERKTRDAAFTARVSRYDQDFRAGAKNDSVSGPKTAERRP